MRIIYVKCDSCGAGHAHKLPRPGQDQRSVWNHWSWTKSQYVKVMNVLCDPCKSRVREFKQQQKAEA